MDFSFDFFDRGINRIGTRSEKWDIALNEGVTADFLPMWVADMDFESPPTVQQAILSRASHGTFGYTGDAQDDAQAALDFWKRRHDVSLEEDQLLMLPCVVTGLKACIQTFTQPGDGVIIQPPVYGPFFSSITSNGRTVVENPLVQDEQGHWHMNLSQLEEQLQAGAKMMLLCSPHNPVSRVWSKEELQALFHVLHQYHTPLVCDEIHADFYFAPSKFVPALSLTGSNPNAKVVTLAAASKTFNLAGLQQAVLFTRHKEMREKIEKTMYACGIKSGNIFALEATRAAYDTGDAWLNGLIAYLDAGRQLLADLLVKHLPKVRMSPVEGTYLAWLDMRSYGFTNKEIMERTQRLGLMLTDGTFFGRQAGEGFMRLNFGCPHKNIAEAVTRLKKALEEA